MPNCSAITSGAWFGSMTPPAPTRIVPVACGEMGDHDRGRGARDPAQVVVLRDPVARVPEPLGVAHEVDRVPQRVARRGAGDDRGDVEDRDGQHAATIPTAPRPEPRPSCRALDPPPANVVAGLVLRPVPARATVASIRCMIVAGVEVRRQHVLELASLLTRKGEDVTARNLTTAIVTGKEEVELTEVDRERIVDLLREAPLGLEELLQRAPRRARVLGRPALAEHPAEPRRGQASSTRPGNRVRRRTPPANVPSGATTVSVVPGPSPVER